MFCIKIIQRLLAVSRPTCTQLTIKSTSPPYRLEYPTARRHRQLRRPREPSIKLTMAIDNITTESQQAQFDVDALLDQHAHQLGHDMDDDPLDATDDPMMRVDRPHRRRKTSKWRSFAGVVVDEPQPITRIPRQNDRFKTLLDSIQRMVRDASDCK